MHGERSLKITFRVKTWQIFFLFWKLECKTRRIAYNKSDVCHGEPVSLCLAFCKYAPFTNDGLVFCPR